MEPENPLLDDFMLSLCRRKPARVCFIPSASADSATYVVNFYRAFGGALRPRRSDHLRLAHPGAVLAGISAGMLCRFRSGLTDSFGDLRPPYDGLGLLRGAACPHYDGEPGRRAA